MEINNSSKSIVKRLQPCKTCADTITGLPTGQIRTIDSTHFGQKVDSVYNTTEDCPVCKGSKYFFA